MIAKEQLIGNEEERAVSPVIGVILMVAITVILAAVIAAFVLGIGPGDDPVEGAIDITVTDHTDDSTQMDVQLSVTDDGNLDQVNLGGCVNNADDVITDIEVGNEETETIDAGDHDCGDNDTINVIGVGPDGNEEVIGSVTV